MTRRDFLAAGAALAASPALAQENLFKLRIAPLTLDIGNKRSVKTVAYNGQVPGPMLRFPEGKTITVDISNETAIDELKVALKENGLRFLHKTQVTDDDMVQTVRSAPAKARSSVSPASTDTASATACAPSMAQPLTRPSPMSPGIAAPRASFRCGRFPTT